jgi:small neutral amino acid transporter SnatA (MarC family)
MAGILAPLVAMVGVVLLELSTPAVDGPSGPAYFLLTLEVPRAVGIVASVAAYVFAWLLVPVALLTTWRIVRLVRTRGLEPSVRSPER